MKIYFDSPVSCSNYSVSVSVAIGFELRSRNYLTGEVVFSLIGENGTTVAAVNGIIVNSESKVSDAVISEISK